MTNQQGVAPNLLISSAALAIAVLACTHDPAPTIITPPSAKIVPASVQSYSGSYVNTTHRVSENWSGYVIKPKPGQPINDDVSDVKAHWIVPVISCGLADSFSSTWVGIDGDGDRTVEQIGTDQDCTVGEPNYYAWFETFPRPSREIATLSMAPGDVVSAEVKFTGQNNFMLAISNLTTGQTFSITRAVPGARRRSAEWIVEAPYSGSILPLTDFNVIQLSGATATFRGHTGTISDKTWSASAIIMAQPHGTIKAQPSGLTADGTGFEVIWHSR